MQVKRYYLNGIDYFQLLIDHHNKKLGGTGHEARLAIYLDGIVDENKILEIISENEHCTLLSSLTINKTKGLGYPSAVFSRRHIPVPVSFYKITGAEIPAEYLNKGVDVYNMPPLHLQVLYLNNNSTCLLFTFHHIVFDFAGVQSFIASLTGKKYIPVFPPKIKNVNITLRVQRFFRAVFFTFREANSRMTIPERELPVKKPLQIIYREIQFSAAETILIAENYRRVGLQINKSIFQVACVCLALHSEIFSKQKNHNFIWIPVPVNVRKKGNEDAILFNGLSFLFYKLDRNSLESKDKTIASLLFQMKDQIKKDLPKSFIDFADGYWYMPMPFYYPMMNLPSLGKLSSLSFSTLDNTFNGFENFMGHRVSEIKNYPSNSIAPGFTFLFYEFRGALRLMTSWVEGQYSSVEQENVINKIKELMLQTKN